MPVTFESGDIFVTPGLRGFAHGCNCAGAMGKGIALSFRGRWPSMYEEYRRRCKDKSFQLGDVFTWSEQGETVFNLGTQRSWMKKAELWAVQKSFGGMILAAEASNIMEIALPRIGAGLGGLDWSAVRTLLEDVAGMTPIHLRVCETYIQGKPLAP